jgi:hypothetical protein
VVLSREGGDGSTSHSDLTTPDRSKLPTPDSHPCFSSGNGIRTRVLALRGLCPGPLDDTARMHPHLIQPARPGSHVGTGDLRRTGREYNSASSPEGGA